MSILNIKNKQQYIEKYQLVKSDLGLLSSFIDFGMTSSSNNFSV